MLTVIIRASNHTHLSLLFLLHKLHTNVTEIRVQQSHSSHGATYIEVIVEALGSDSLCYLEIFLDKVLSGLEAEDAVKGGGVRLRRLLLLEACLFSFNFIL